MSQRPLGAYYYHNNFAFNPDNEPDLHAPWRYAWTGAPWKTSAVLRAARTLFTDTPYGMPGNGDLGTISSWLVFGMAGIFEAQPGSGTYLLSTPMFERVEIQPGHGRKIEIEAPGASASKLQYTKDVQIGPRDYDRSWISHADLPACDERRRGSSGYRWCASAAVRPLLPRPAATALVFSCHRRDRESPTSGTIV